MNSIEKEINRLQSDDELVVRTLNVVQKRLRKEKRTKRILLTAPLPLAAALVLVFSFVLTKGKTETKSGYVYQALYDSAGSGYGIEAGVTRSLNSRWSGATVKTVLVSSDGEVLNYGMDNN